MKRLSVREDGPADGIAPSLIVDDECPDLHVELAPLPVTLHPTRPGVAGVRCARGSDRVRRCTEVVFGDVANTGSVPGGIGGVASGPLQRASRAHRVAAAGPSVHHRHLASGPSTCRLDRLARPSVHWLFGLEQGQDMLRAQGSPQSQAPMIRIGERSATANGDHPRIAHLRQDHAPRPSVIDPAARCTCTGGTVVMSGIGGSVDAAATRPASWSLHGRSRTGFSSSTGTRSGSTLTVFRTSARHVRPRQRHLSA
jgi:hypothetical protein